MNPSHSTVLIVDDDAAQRKVLADFLSHHGYQTAQAGSAEEALREAGRVLPDVVLLDVRLPGRSGLEIVPELKALLPAAAIILITAYGEVRQAVAAIKAGATDYLTKPLDLDELLAVVADAAGSSCHSKEGEGKLPPLPPGFVCLSAALKHVLKVAAAVAPNEIPVLVTGESGSGKEWIARIIHLWSGRSQGPFLAINCAAVSESLLESELFGHTKGAFTGAAQGRLGLFRSAEKGTLFLDEIGELPLHLQAKILRAIETGEIFPVGSDTPCRVDVRLVAATNRNLPEMVEKGNFRADLYYRLNVIEIRVPPLRERVDEILPLARHFASEITRQPVRFSPQAEECLLAYSWPGNVRELRNAIHRACLLSRGDVILPEHLPPAVIGATAGQSVRAGSGRLSQLEQAAILAALAECGGNRTRAAEKLGISRRALLYKLRAMQAQGISLPPPVGQRPGAAEAS
ncbi:MAG: sigma-54 dependent transcriptional regulator [Thermoguttaceae bacterium]|nr:sigma-54 dependent transcriptional regulator [Thermoguttaceae bacterium]MDW8077786.1 sigma-54 dependent transcriptional regulator [Thermoguttaceae bacterium]